MAINSLFEAGIYVIGDVKRILKIDKCGEGNLENILVDLETSSYSDLHIWDDERKKLNGLTIKVDDEMMCDNSDIEGFYKITSGYFGVHRVFATDENMSEDEINEKIEHYVDKFSDGCNIIYCPKYFWMGVDGHRGKIVVKGFKGKKGDLIFSKMNDNTELISEATQNIYDFLE